MRSFTKRRIRIWQMSSYKNHLAPARYIVENVFADRYKRGGKMIGKRTAIWKREEYSYESEERDIPYVISYMHEDGQIPSGNDRCAGRSYRQVSSSEGDIVARTFYRAGYNALVLTYSVNPTSEGELCTFSRLEIWQNGAARTLLCETVPDRSGEVAVCGFSAGGHLCGSLGVHFQDIKEENSLLKEVSCRPDAMILGYPVITSGKYRNEDSFLALLGEDSDEEEREYLSVEKHVTEEMPPCFCGILLKIRPFRRKTGICLPKHAGRRAYLMRIMYLRKGHMGCLSPQKNGLNKN